MSRTTCSRRITSTPDPDTFEKYRDTPPISVAILWEKYALLLAQSSTNTANLYHHTLPLCIAILLLKYQGQGSLEHSQMFWGRVFHVKGWGPKSSVCPSKPRETKLFGGTPRDFAGISQGRPKSLRKNSLCSILVP